MTAPCALPRPRSPTGVFLHDCTRPLTWCCSPWSCGGRWPVRGEAGRIRRGDPGPGDGPVQPRHPADPGRQVLQVPRSRRHQRKAKLRLDSLAATPRPRPPRAARRSCRASSRRASSYQRITSDDPDERMPPAKTRQAAHAGRDPARSRPGSSRGPSTEAHWAFIPPVRPDAPRGQEPGLGAATRSTPSSWPGSRRRGSRPSPEADGSRCSAGSAST